MASIAKRKNSWSVVYYYTDESGKRKQKWERFTKIEDTEQRKKDLEQLEKYGHLHAATQSIDTFGDLINRYVEIEGKEKWAPSTYTGNLGLIKNYIIPIIGSKKIHEVNTTLIEDYYKIILLNTPAVERKGRYTKRMVSNSTIREIHKIINPALKYGVVKKLFNTNPADYITLPRVKKKSRDIWTLETFEKACTLCDNEQLDAIMHIAFACSLRIGEILGLTWDCVEISENAINSGTAFLRVNKQLQRANLDATEIINQSDDEEVLFIFPPVLAHSKSRIILKEVKTESSDRIVFLPKTVAKKLIRIKEIQDSWKNILGDDYIDYNQVFTKPDGNPILTRVVEKWFDDLIKRNDLPKVVFHSLRHTSTTYKLRLFKDIKAVQGEYLVTHRVKWSQTSIPTFSMKIVEPMLKSSNVNSIIKIQLILLLLHHHLNRKSLLT